VLRNRSEVDRTAVNVAAGHGLARDDLLEHVRRNGSAGEFIRRVQQLAARADDEALVAELAGRD